MPWDLRSAAAVIWLAQLLSKVIETTVGPAAEAGAAKRGLANMAAAAAAVSAAAAARGVAARGLLLLGRTDNGIRRESPCVIAKPPHM
jgi:hypothetical protein